MIDSQGAESLQTKYNTYPNTLSVDSMIEEYIRRHPEALTKYKRGDTDWYRSFPSDDMPLHQSNSLENNNNNNNSNNSEYITSRDTGAAYTAQKSDEPSILMCPQTFVDRNYFSTSPPITGDNNVPTTVVASVEGSQQYDNNTVDKHPYNMCHSPEIPDLSIFIAAQRQIQQIIEMMKVRKFAHQLFDYGSSVINNNKDNNDNISTRKKSVTILSSSDTAIDRPVHHHNTATMDTSTNTDSDTSTECHDPYLRHVHTPYSAIGVHSYTNYLYNLLHMLILAMESSERNEIETLYWEGGVRLMIYIRKVCDHENVKEGWMVHDTDLVYSDGSRISVHNQSLKERKLSKGAITNDDSLLNRSVVFVHGERHTADQKIMLLVQWRGHDRQEQWMPLEEVRHFAVVDAYLNRYDGDEIEDNNQCSNDNGDMVDDDKICDYDSLFSLEGSLSEDDDITMGNRNDKIKSSRKRSSALDSRGAGQNGCYQKCVLGGIMKDIVETHTNHTNVIDELEWDDMQQQLASIQRAGSSLHSAYDTFSESYSENKRNANIRPDGMGTPFDADASYNEGLERDISSVHLQSVDGLDLTDISDKSHTQLFDEVLCNEIIDDKNTGLHRLRERHSNSTPFGFGGTDGPVINREVSSMQIGQLSDQLPPLNSSNRPQGSHYRRRFVTCATPLSEPYSSDRFPDVKKANTNIAPTPPIKEIQKSNNPDHSSSDFRLPSLRPLSALYTPTDLIDMADDRNTVLESSSSVNVRYRTSSHTSNRRSSNEEKREIINMGNYLPSKQNGCDVVKENCCISTAICDTGDVLMSRDNRPTSSSSMIDNTDYIGKCANLSHICDTKRDCNMDGVSDIGDYDDGTDTILQKYRERKRFLEQRAKRQIYGVTDIKSDVPVSSDVKLHKIGTDIDVGTVHAGTGYVSLPPLTAPPSIVIESQQLLPPENSRSSFFFKAANTNLLLIASLD